VTIQIFTFMAVWYNLGWIWQDSMDLLWHLATMTWKDLHAWLTIKDRLRHIMDVTTQNISDNIRPLFIVRFVHICKKNGQAYRTEKIINWDLMNGIFKRLANGKPSVCFQSEWNGNLKNQSLGRLSWVLKDLFT